MSRIKNLETSPSLSTQEFHYPSCQSWLAIFLILIIVIVIVNTTIIIKGNITSLNIFIIIIK